MSRLMSTSREVPVLRLMALARAAHTLLGEVTMGWAMRQVRTIRWLIEADEPELALHEIEYLQTWVRLNNELHQFKDPMVHRVENVRRALS